MIIALVTNESLHKNIAATLRVFITPLRRLVKQIVLFRLWRDSEEKKMFTRIKKHELLPR